MQRKYKVNSASTLIPMVINFSKIEDGIIGEGVSTHVKVDYFNNRVYFENQYLFVNVNINDLEQEILAYLRPNLLDAPKISPDMLRRVGDVRAGRYGADLEKTRI